MNDFQTKITFDGHKQLETIAKPESPQVKLFSPQFHASFQKKIRIYHDELSTKKANATMMEGLTLKGSQVYEQELSCLLNDG